MVLWTILTTGSRRYSLRPGNQLPKSRRRHGPIGPRRSRPARALHVDRLSVELRLVFFFLFFFVLRVVLILVGEEGSAGVGRILHRLHLLPFIDGQ